MAMNYRTKCAVVDCAGPISGANNLCDHHRLPGLIVQVDDSTMTSQLGSLSMGMR